MKPTEFTYKEKNVLTNIHNGVLDVEACSKPKEIDDYGFEFNGLSIRSIKTILSNLKKKGAIESYTFNGDVVEVKIVDDVKVGDAYGENVNKFNLKQILLICTLATSRNNTDTNYALFETTQDLDSIQSLKDKGFFDSIEFVNNGIKAVYSASGREFLLNHRASNGRKVFSDLDGGASWRDTFLDKESSHKNVVETTANEPEVEAPQQESAVETTSSDSVEANVDEADALRQAWLVKMKHEREPIKRLIAFLMHKSSAIKAEKAKENVEPKIKLTKQQQRIFTAMKGHPEWQDAFIELIEKNGRRWHDALTSQFMTDANVCGISSKKLCYIRQIRNSHTLDIFSML